MMKLSKIIYKKGYFLDSFKNTLALWAKIITTQYGIHIIIKKLLIV